MPGEPDPFQISLGAYCGIDKLNRGLLYLATLDLGHEQPTGITTIVESPRDQFMQVFSKAGWASPEDARTVKLEDPFEGLTELTYRDWKMTAVGVSKLTQIIEQGKGCLPFERT